MRAGTQQPPEHHPQAEGNRDQPAGQRDKAECGSAYPRGCRGSPLRVCRGSRPRCAAPRRDGADHLPQIMTRLSYSLALCRLSARANGRGVKGAADREADLGSCQAPAFRWQRGDRDVMPDRSDTELDARFHRGSRGRLTGASGDGKCGEDHPRRHQARQGRGPCPGGCALSHVSKLITARRQARTSHHRGYVTPAPWRQRKHQYQRKHQ